MEIASCSGNISTMKGKNYLHIHMVVGNVTRDFCCGGHLNRAVISLTGEFVIHKIAGEVDRAYRLRSPEPVPVRGLRKLFFPETFEKPVGSQRTDGFVIGIGRGIMRLTNQLDEGTFRQRKGICLSGSWHTWPSGDAPARHRD